jgi:hypothetical protein
MCEATGIQTCSLYCDWEPCLRVLVTPANPSVAAGRTQQFYAIGHYSDGNEVDLSNEVTWSSTDGAVATILNSDGFVGTATGRRIGVTTIVADYDGIIGSTTLTVTAAELVSIAVTPADSNVRLATSLQMKATGTYTDGTTLDLTTSVTWSSSSGLVRIGNTAGSQGLAHGAEVGTATITAGLGSVTGATRLTVTQAPLRSIEITPANSSIAVGTTQQFIATAIYTDATREDVTELVAWSSSNTAVATISFSPGTEGRTSGVAAGMSTISATLAGITGSTTLNVSNAALTAIAVTPIHQTILVGATLQFTAIGSFNDATTQDITSSVAWTASDPAVATMSTLTGLATSVSAGTTTINATSGRISGATSLTVR